MGAPRSIVKVLVPCACLALGLGSTIALAEEAPKGVSDDEISLYPGSVFDVITPAEVHENATDPGDGPLFAPAHEEAPPVVPHALADYLPITLEENLCIDCHAIEEPAEGDPTPIPESHYVDLRRAPDTVGESLAGSRWVCVSCHVGRTDAAESLVESSFVSPAAAPEEVAPEATPPSGD